MDGLERQDWLRVGFGREAVRWSTRSRTSKVLFVVHNMTSATRLMDVMPLFSADLHVAQFVTCTGSSPFQAGIADCGKPTRRETGSLPIRVRSVAPSLRLR